MISGVSLRLLRNWLSRNHGALSYQHKSNELVQTESRFANTPSLSTLLERHVHVLTHMRYGWWRGLFLHYLGSVKQKHEWGGRDGGSIDDVSSIGGKSLFGDRNGKRLLRRRSRQVPCAGLPNCMFGGLLLSRINIDTGVVSATNVHEGEATLTSQVMFAREWCPNCLST